MLPAAVSFCAADDTKGWGPLILGQQATGTAELEARLRNAGPWFHNISVHGVPTAPEHFLGDYPFVKWRYLRDALPADMTGKSVLDIGCNAGYYAIELKRRGAARVLGIDTEELYLQQARLVREELELDIEYRHCSAYDVVSIPEQFDVVLFMGIFYHLRYPLYALDRVVQKVKPGGMLVFQTLMRPHDGVAKEAAGDYPFWEEAIFTDPQFPQTNWWVPNQSAVEAMLRSAGLRLDAHPEEETWLCTPVGAQRRGKWIQELEFEGKLW